MKNRINLFLVDDHKMFVEGISYLLNEKDQFAIIGHASNGKEALQKIKSLKVDIILSDISMPQMDGLALTREIKKVSPETRIMIVSSFCNASMIENAKKVGVDGYLLKNTGRAELLLALDHLASGRKYFAEEVRRIHADSLYSEKKEPDMITLSPREIDILKYISEEKSTQEISEILHLSVNTVETHRKNLMRKIGAKNMVGLVKYAIQQNLI